MAMEKSTQQVEKNDLRMKTKTAEGLPRVKYLSCGLLSLALLVWLPNAPISAAKLSEDITGSATVMKSAAHTNQMMDEVGGEARESAGDGVDGGTGTGGAGSGSGGGNGTGGTESGKGNGMGGNGMGGGNTGGKTGGDAGSGTGGGTGGKPNIGGDTSTPSKQPSKQPGKQPDMSHGKGGSTKGHVDKKSGARQ